ncbi:MAG TPA: 2-hydroxyacyl-CoA dehydratase family protein [Spirochaetota bacterium]|nr:2-hydroxyacyl-CoA dehydratase family protein [Spirochaetota bacterium]HPI90742.1 2-hydroxyacyl-CoA dehydratase family protein [Spirochaetota bacterium]HPR46354.1 2-hydroxyacyl-CoA dehydratase family protein [Spirochaetota bacterium]
MRESILSPMIDPLQEMLYQSHDVLRSFKERNGCVLAGLSCDFLPPEVIASFGVVPLRFPVYLCRHGCGDEGARYYDHGDSSPYDFFIAPEGCPSLCSLPEGPVPVHQFRFPSGYGEDARRLLYEEIAALMQKAGRTALDLNVLRDLADEYNTMRRLMRGILSVRSAKPHMISHHDLLVLIEAASVFPPEVMLEPLAGILRELNAGESRESAGVPAMVYGGFLADGSVLDEIEEAGCLVVEDDLCNGRRHFDLSINIAAEDLLAEILDAFTYRPLCPRVRSPEERFELLYKLLKSHGIDLVILLSDGCECRRNGLEYLRVKLMRAGVDPLPVSRESAVHAVKEYLKRR